MNKGFIFSIDALFAIVVIIAASTAFVFLTPKADSELLSLQAFRIKASDNAIVSFYLGRTTTIVPGSFLDSKSTAYCATYYFYPFNSTSAQSAVTPDYNCEGK